MRKGLFIQSGLRGHEREDSLKLISKFLPGSIVLTKKDFDGKSGLLELLKEINRIYLIENGVDRPYIALDQEGGNVVRLDWLNYNPSNAFLGRFDNQKFTRYVASLTGYELRNLGIDWNLAPVLDLFNQYNQVILERSFSGDPEVVALHGSAYIQGIQRRGVAATAKHFPGHGGVVGDSHLVLPVDSRSRTSVINDMYPFRSAVDVGVRSVMLSHVCYAAIDENYPASLSRIIYDMLREELKFTGVIITDSLNMKAVSSNYSVKEIAKLASGNGADVLESVDIDTALELCDHLEMKEEQASASRIKNILPLNSEKFHPPDEILRAASILGSRWIRKRGTLDPNESTALIFLDDTKETIASERQSSAPYIMERISAISLDVQLYVTDTVKDISSTTLQAIIIGRNEHLKERMNIIKNISDGRNTLFISTGVPVDVGTIPEGIGYISSLSSKTDNVLGSIYKAFGFI